MMGFVWDMDIALEVEREEAYEKCQKDVARNMLKKGFSFEQTAELSGLDIERVRDLLSSI